MSKRDYLQYLGGVLLIATPDLDVEFCSSNSSDFIGYTPEEINYSSIFWINNIHPEQQQLFLEKIQMLSIKGEIELIEYQFQTSNGDFRWFQSRVFKFENDRGETRISMFTTDVHERKLAELSKEEDRALNTEILKHLSNVFFLFTHDGRFIRWNNRLVEVSGYSNEEIQVIHPLEFFPEEAKSRVNEMIHAVFEHGRVELESPFVAKDGSMKQIHFIGSRFSYKGELCVSGVAIDISAQKNAQIALNKSNSRFEKIMKASSESIWELDVTTGALFLGDGFTRIFGIEVKHHE